MIHDLSARKKRQMARERFTRARRAEAGYRRKLHEAVDRIRLIFRKHSKDFDTAALERDLEIYASQIRPWAERVAYHHQQEILRRDEQSWTDLGKEIGVNLRHKIRKANVEPTLRDLLSEQVHLITSLPRQAAERVHHLTLRGLVTGARADTVQKDIMRTPHVTWGRAKTIARTETARTASLLTENRAKQIGSEGYIWRTSGDSDVRKEHKKLEGKFIPWDRPPIASSNGMRYHAGQGPNCRCYPEPVVPDQL